jgi:hypothetical protein
VPENGEKRRKLLNCAADLKGFADFDVTHGLSSSVIVNGIVVGIYFLAISFQPSAIR